ncbi:MAG: DUF6807 family protein, partial [Bacteroidota bacterium]
MKKEWLFFCVLIVTILCPFVSTSQLIAQFTFAAANSTIATPVSIDLDQLTAADDSSLVLREVTDKRNTEIPFQVEHGYHRFLWWLVENQRSSSAKKHVFELSKTNSPHSASPSVEIKDIDDGLVIEAGKKKVLQYNYKTNYPPQGVDTFFKRSGFIHPLWSPAGNVLTQINPKDHYHHVGIWNPWTDVVFRGKKVDFWNLGDKKGTVRFAKFIAKESGPVFGGFKALQEHIVFNSPSAGMETCAMNEIWDIRVFNVGSKMWLWDFTSTLNCA